jgi:hypothetical protein
MISLFKKKQTNNTYTPIVPSGLIAHTEKGYFYIKGKKKFKFVSERAMLSWCLPVIKTTENQINVQVLAGTLGFRDGTLVKDISDGKIYLISDSKKRHIVEPDVLEWVGSKVIDGSQKEIMIHEEGDPLNGS